MKRIDHRRLDLDLLHLDKVTLDPIQPSLTVESEHYQIDVNADQLKTIFYRAPTHLRESSGLDESYELRLRRHQWTAFARGLMCFDKAEWVNNPSNTFQAESKPYQLKVAADLGFATPQTRISNNNKVFRDITWDSIAIKALDSFLVPDRNGNKLFLYTQMLNNTETHDISLQDMPVIAQYGFTEKTDIRVTVIDKWIFAVAIKDDSAIDGDWRLKKDKVIYEEISLPVDLRLKCFKLMESLGLRYGAIDLLKVKSDYFFLEINPTGEWGWLETALNVDISGVIADALVRKN